METNVYHLNTYFHCGSDSSFKESDSSSMTPKEDIEEDIDTNSNPSSYSSTLQLTHEPSLNTEMIHHPQSDSSSMTLRSTTPPTELWEKAKEKLKGHIGRLGYEHYLADTKVVKIDKDVLIIRAGCCNLHQLERLKGLCESTAGTRVSFVPGGEE